jgi:hypothetical protein
MVLKRAGKVVAGAAPTALVAGLDLPLRIGAGSPASRSGQR